MSMVLDYRFFLVLLLIFVLFYAIIIPMSQTHVLPVAVGTLVDHGSTKHGTDADIVRRCIEKQGADIIYDKLFDKKVQLCLMEDGLGIEVSCKHGNIMCRITAYIDRTIRSVDEMISYAEQDMGQYGNFSYAKEIIKSKFNIIY